MPSRASWILAWLSVQRLARCRGNWRWPSSTAGTLISRGTQPSRLRLLLRYARPLQHACSLIWQSSSLVLLFQAVYAAGVTQCAVLSCMLVLHHCFQAESSNCCSVFGSRIHLESLLASELLRSAHRVMPFLYLLNSY